MKKETKEYIKYHFLSSPKHYMGFGEKNIEIRERYEQHHALAFKIALTFFVLAVSGVIATKTYDTIMGLIIISIFLIILFVFEIIRITYHQETTRLMKKKK